MKDGILILSTGERVMPNMTLGEFTQAFPNAARAAPIHEKWQTYAINRTTIDGREFNLSAMFEDGRLLTVGLTDPDLDAQGWDGLTKDAVAKTCATLDQWLLAQLGATRVRLPWGHVISGPDRDGIPQIVFAYYQPKNW